jgi:hypothetical protein
MTMTHQSRFRLGCHLDSVHHRAPFILRTEQVVGLVASRATDKSRAYSVRCALSTTPGATNEFAS